MAKFDKYVLKQTKPTAKVGAATPQAFDKGPVKDWAGIAHRFVWTHVNAPTVIETEAHSHDFDEYLCFCSADPATPFDFGAEVELSLGSEGEKQVITNSSIVCVPKGLVHGPINFIKVSKPVLFTDIYSAHAHVKKPK